MQLNEPKQKKNCRLPTDLPVPVILKKDGSIHKFKGIFNGFSVVVEDEDMKSIIPKGYFGKANFSRSYLQFGQNTIDILRCRQYHKRQNIAEKYANCSMTKKVIVVPDSDEEINYVTNLKPEYKIDNSGIKEGVWLSLEESFFLANAINSLNIYFENKHLTPKEIWKIFNEADPYFVQNYIVYYYFRAKNWVVKPGIKFGGDFLLYKQGPPFYHASYVVLIDILNENLKRNINLSRRLMDDISLISLNRLCETAGKELLICQVIWPQNVQIDYNNLTDITIKETLIRRWTPTHERNDED